MNKCKLVNLWRPCDFSDLRGNDERYERNSEGDVSVLFSSIEANWKQNKTKNPTCWEVEECWFHRARNVRSGWSWHHQAAVPLSAVREKLWTVKTVHWENFLVFIRANRNRRLAKVSFTAFCRSYPNTAISNEWRSESSKQQTRPLVSHIKLVNLNKGDV